MELAIPCSVRDDRSRSHDWLLEKHRGFTTDGPVGYSFIIPSLYYRFFGAHIDEIHVQ